MIDIKKYQLHTHVYSSPLQAAVAGESLGLGKEFHVHQVEGQAYYMPGRDHMDYLRAMGYEEPEEVEEDRMVEALRAVVAEIIGKFEDWGEEDDITKADYQGKEVPLNKPRRLSGESKKFEVFVRDGDKVKRVTFGDPNMEIRRDDPDARAAFRSRHSCDTAKDKTSARYWSCRMWEKGSTVSDITKISVGDRVSWGSSGGIARGIVRQVVRDGKVPNIPVTVNGTKEEPAARIELLDDEGKPRGEYVGHKISTLNKSDNSPEAFNVLKVDEEQRIIYGWGSVTTYKGEVVVDREGDWIATDTLHKAVNNFMKGIRVGKLNHRGEAKGTIVHSFPITKELCDALGIQSDREGWITGYYVEDDDLWESVKAGDYAEFSIGGRGDIVER